MTTNMNNVALNQQLYNATVSAGSCSTLGVSMPTLPQHLELNDVNNGGVEEDKKMKRVLKNRRAAKASYERRKKMITDLHNTVADLTQENKEVKSENDSLKKQLEEMKKKVAGLVAKLGRDPADADLIEADADISHPSSTTTSVGELSNSDLIEDDADVHHPFPEMTLCLKTGIDAFPRQNSLGLDSVTSLSRNSSYVMTSLSRNGSRCAAPTNLSRDNSLFSGMSACSNLSLSRSNSLVPPAFFSVTSCGSMGSDASMVGSMSGMRMMATA